MRSLLLQREDYKEVSEGQSVHLCGVVCACMYTDSVADTGGGSVVSGPPPQT